MVQFQNHRYKLRNNNYNKFESQEDYLKLKQFVASKTQGKFILMNQNEYSKYLDRHVRSDKLLGSQQINTSSDIAKCRKLVDSICGSHFNNYIKRLLLLMTSEAATNIVKHAYYGNLTVVKSTGYLRLIFKDHGPGILYEYIPIILFCWGTTLDDSLGAGLILIYNYADRSLLYTTNNGTTLIIEKRWR